MAEKKTGTTALNDNAVKMIALLNVVRKVTYIPHESAAFERLQQLQHQQPEWWDTLTRGENTARIKACQQCKTHNLKQVDS